MQKIHPGGQCETIFYNKLGPYEALTHLNITSGVSAGRPPQGASITSLQSFAPACTVKLYILHERSRRTFHYAVICCMGTIGSQSRLLLCPFLCFLFVFAHRMKLDIDGFIDLPCSFFFFFFAFKYFAPAPSLASQAYETTLHLTCPLHPVLPSRPVYNHDNINIFIPAMLSPCAEPR